MANWKPDPEFLEFFDELEKAVGDKMPKEVWAMIMEVRTGSEIGRLFYVMAMKDPDFRADYDAWKNSR